MTCVGIRRAVFYTLGRALPNLLRRVLGIPMTRSLKLWPCLIAVSTILFFSSNSSFAKDRTEAERSRNHNLAGHEQAVFRPAIQKSRFTDIPHVSGQPRCRNTRPPEALATSSPQLPSGDADEKLVVSFIVGIDGKVHSALVLQGGDDWTDRVVLQTIRHWRYRPATCNGVPTESEAKVEFSRPRS
jgi:TonB family protein